MLEDYSKEGVKRHNKAMKELAQMFHELKSNPLAAEFLYKELMDSDIEVVQCMSAAHSLGMNINVKKAQKTLKSISQSGSKPLTRFTAQMTLKTWLEQGYLKF